MAHDRMTGMYLPSVAQAAVQLDETGSNLDAELDALKYALAKNSDPWGNDETGVLLRHHMEPARQAIIDAGGKLAPEFPRSAQKLSQSMTQFDTTDQDGSQRINRIPV